MFYQKSILVPFTRYLSSYIFSAMTEMFVKATTNKKVANTHFSGATTVLLLVGDRTFSYALAL